MQGVERETGEGFHITVDWCRVVLWKIFLWSDAVMWWYCDKHTKKPFENQLRHLCVSFWYPTHMILVFRVSFSCRWSPIITIKVPNKGVVGGSKSLSAMAEIKQNQTCQGSDTDTMSCLQYYSSVVGKSTVCKRSSVFFCVTSVNWGRGAANFFFFFQPVADSKKAH